MSSTAKFSHTITFPNGVKLVVLPSDCIVDVYEDFKLLGFADLFVNEMKHFRVAYKEWQEANNVLP